jgi:hypothetical protein
MAEVPLDQYLAEADKLNATLREWKDEVTQLVVDYNLHLRTIEDTVERLNATEKTFWVVYSPYIGSLVGLIVVIFVSFLLINSGHFCGTINFPVGGSYTGKSC